jgi:hypothetical protein
MELLMKNALIQCLLALSIFCAITLNAYAQSGNKLVALSTSGTIYEINQNTGESTEIAEEIISSFTLGGIARRNNILYYIATPSASTENSIYKLNIKTKVLSKVDLDRASGDDDVRALFFDGNKLFAVFYNGTAGTAGLYQVNPKTGVTALKINLSDLNYEPIGGGFERFNGFTYMLAKPETDSNARKLMRFKKTARSVKSFDVKDAGGNPVLCERIATIANGSKLVCLASADSSTQVRYCNLKFNGLANCLSVLSDIKRVAGGHTFTTTDGRNFFAFVYDNIDENNNRLLKINKFGVISENRELDGIFVGARFKNEEE